MGCLVVVFRAAGVPWLVFLVSAASNVTANRNRLIGGLLVFLAVSLPAAEAPAYHSWSDEQKERFLREAEIVRSTEIGEGVTISTRAVLRDGDVTHDAQIQHIDITKDSHPTPEGFELNFRDSYKYNIAAYRLDRVLGLGMVPVSVGRIVNQKKAALTWWIDDVLMTEKTRYLKKQQPPDLTRWNRRIHRVRVFDELIYNTDRNLGNLIITTDWKVWMIDHTGAFRTHKRLRDKNKLLKCDRRLLDRLRRLNYEGLRAQLKDFLRESEIHGLLARRDQIVELFEQKIAQRGEKAVLYGSVDE